MLLCSGNRSVYQRIQSVVTYLFAPNFGKLFRQNEAIELGLGFTARTLRRRDVVLAVLAGGSPDAVAQEYCVSRASVYNWVKDYRTSGIKGLIREKGDRRLALDGSSPAELVRNIQGILRHRPEFSADELSAHFASFGKNISPRTMRNIFKSLGVSTAAQRRQRAFQPDFSDISIEDLDAVIRQLENCPSVELFGRKPGDVMVQDRIKLPSRLCVETLAIEIIVDTFAAPRRMYAMVGVPSEQLSRDAIAKVHSLYQQESFRIHKVCTPRKQQYCEALGAIAFPRLFNRFPELVLEVRPVNSREMDSRIKAAWMILQTEWIKSLPNRLPTNRRNCRDVDADLNAWLLARRK
jgi:transposase